MATTAICNSFKQELLQAGHCFNAVLTQTGSTHTNTTLDAMATTAGIAVGMAVTGTSIAANTFVSNITSQTAVVLSIAATGTASNTMTFTGDVFKFALVKVSPSRTFDGTQTNIGTPGTTASSATNLGTDEVAATGSYTSGGFQLTNVTPTLSSTTGITNFSPSPSYTNATISTVAGIIYNSGLGVLATTQGRNGAAAAASINGRTVSVHDFGGTQSVAGGTITFTMPTADSTNAIIRIA